MGFTAAQIPNIDSRRYPPELSGTVALGRVVGRGGVVGREEMSACSKTAAVIGRCFVQQSSDMPPPFSAPPYLVAQAQARAPACCECTCTFQPAPQCTSPTSHSRRAALPQWAPHLARGAAGGGGEEAAGGQVSACRSCSCCSPV